MSDFERRLTVLLDDVAESVRPHPKPDAVFTASVAAPSVTRLVRPRLVGPRMIRPRMIGIAAAGVLLFGGSALAVEGFGGGDEPRSVVPAQAPESDQGHDRDSTSSSPTEPTQSTTKSTVEPTPTVKETPATTTPIKSVVREPLVTKSETTEPSVSATEPPPTTVKVEPPVTTAKPTPTTQPSAPVEFTANLGSDGTSYTPMKQGFYGTAAPGSWIRVGSDFGVSEVQASSKGKWETTLKMIEVPVGATVVVRITANTSNKVHEFSLVRPVPPPPAIEFKAKLGADGSANTPMTQGFFGIAKPGSAIRIASDWGVAETVAGENGEWEATLVMGEVPPGTKIGVRVTANTSDKVYEFGLQRPGSPEPTPVDFTANAGWTSTDATPPAGEYWGTSTAGAVISITSPYGGAQTEANGEGKWSARVEFPSAPAGATFTVRITSSKGSAVYEFPMTPVIPG